MYCYHVYGRSIFSATPIPGLRDGSASGAAKLTLECGAEPVWVAEGRKLPARIRLRRAGSDDPINPSFVLTEYGAACCFEFSYSDGTRFVVHGSTQRVWGTVVPPLTIEDLATYFLGPILGFVLRLGGTTSLHASSIEVADRAVAFVGDAGAGKSTTAAALALRGHAVLAEDIVPLRESSGVFFAVPGYPRVCLWPDSVAKLLGSEDALPRLTPVWEKRYLALDGVNSHFCSKERPLDAIYLIAPRSQEPSAPRVEEVRPLLALMELVQNTYMNWLLDREQRAVEFDLLARLVRKVPVRRIVPSADPRKIGALCEAIARDAEDLVSRTDVLARSVSA